MTDTQARCGSYPFRYIADDYGVPYGVVLRYADFIEAVYYGGIDAATERHKEAGRAALVYMARLWKAKEKEFMQAIVAATRKARGDV